MEHVSYFWSTQWPHCKWSERKVMRNLGCGSQNWNFIEKKSIVQAYLFLLLNLFKCPSILWEAIHLRVPPPPSETQKFLNYENYQIFTLKRQYRLKNFVKLYQTWNEASQIVSQHVCQVWSLYRQTGNLNKRWPYQLMHI